MHDTLEHLTQQIMMNRAEAQEHVDRINANGDAIRADLLDLYELEGWRALGYKSWRECAVAEFPKWSQSYLYYQLKIARTEQGLLDAPDIEPDFSKFLESLPESHINELSALEDPLERRIAVQLAYSASTKGVPSGKVTASTVRDAVETVQEIKATNGKVDLGDGTMTAAEASVVAKQYEHVQAHIDNTNAARNRNAGTTVYVFKNARVRLSGCLPALGRIDFLVDQEAVAKFKEAMNGAGEYRLTLVRVGKS